MAKKKRSKSLTHIDSRGRASMVDVGAKPVTSRRAVAEARVQISAELARRIAQNSLAKGNVLDVARLAGIQAAKRTDELIPLCHSLPLDSINVRAQLRRGHVHLWAEAKVTAKTGVEMEALLAVAIAALTVIDMGKSIDKSMTVEGLRLLEKEGGRSGHFVARSAMGGVRRTMARNATSGANRTMTRSASRGAKSAQKVRS